MARLLRISKDKGLNFDLVLTHYAIERLLFRLAQSKHVDRFVLKGAMLFMTWFYEPIRGTRDLDLLGYGEPSQQFIRSVFAEILCQEHPDGVRFDVDAIRIDATRSHDPYGGVRHRTTADFGGAQIAVHVDVGFGDAVEPPAKWLDYPVLLDMPSPRLLGYAHETVIAEKFQALVDLGLANSRIKDYYDLWIISKAFDIDQSLLAQSIAATFVRRGTEIPIEIPDGLSPIFSNDPLKRQLWNRLVGDLEINPHSLEDIVAELADFLMPVATSANQLVPPRTKSPR